MLKELSIFVTSWARYNEGSLPGHWFNIISEDGDVSNWETLRADLIEKGFDIDGYDEELVIHDYDDYYDGAFAEFFGESHPKSVVDAVEPLADLSQDSLTVFFAITEAHGFSFALEELDEGTLDNHIIIEDMDNFILESAFEEFGLEDNDRLRAFFNFAEYGEDIKSEFTETSYGWISDSQ